MKYLILSDIHGSFYYLNEVLQKESFDKLILLGDILPHGPRNDLPLEYNPKKIIPILNGYKDKIICIRGNCDAEVDQMVFEFPIVKLACLELNNKTIYLTHGHEYNYLKPLPCKNAFVLYGHTHVARVDLVDSVTYINPGSLSIPKDDAPSFAVIEDGVLKCKRFDGTLKFEVNLWKD